MATGTRGGAGRSRRAHRGTGAAITAVLLVAIVGVAAVILNTRPQYRVTPADSNQLINAISKVPDTDVDGTDPVPRPPGMKRSYYSQRGRVTTVVYIARAPYEVARDATVALLTNGGWTPPPNAPPGRVSTQSDSYTAVYAQGSRLLQLAVTTIQGVTSVTYIIQATT